MQDAADARGRHLWTVTAPQCKPLSQEALLVKHTVKQP